MAFCRMCGARFGAGHVFCPACRTPLELTEPFLSRPSTMVALVVLLIAAAAAIVFTVRHWP